MNGRRTPFRTLVRIRRLQRDLEARSLRESTAAKLHAVAEARRADERAASEASLLDRQQGEGDVVARMRAAATAVGLLYSDAARKQDRTRQSIDSEIEARKAWIQAERSLKGAERIEERQQQEARAELARIEQRRLDDRPGRVLSAARRNSLLLVAACMLFAPQLRAESSTGSVAGLLSEIRTRMTELDRREAELSERRSAIAELERAVETRIRELDEVSLRVEKQINAWEEAQGAKSISRLAKIYGAMPAQDAADLMESLELDLATTVFAKMKPKKSAALLPLLSEARALAITRFVGHPLGITSTRTASTAK